MDFLERSQAWVPLVIREWAAHAQARPPWSEMPLDDLLGELPALTAALLEEVMSRESAGDGAAHAEEAEITEPAEPAERAEPAEGASARTLADAARRHGAFRRRQGCDISVLAEDYEALRRALRSTLRAASIPVNRMAGVLYETLVALRKAARASTDAFQLADAPGEGGLEPERRRSQPEEP